MNVHTIGDWIGQSISALVAAAPRLPFKLQASGTSTSMTVKQAATNTSASMMTCTFRTRTLKPTSDTYDNIRSPNIHRPSNRTGHLFLPRIQTNIFKIMPDIPHLPNSPEEEEEYAKQESFIRNWEIENKNKCFLDMSLPELNKLIEKTKENENG